MEVYNENLGKLARKMDVQIEAMEKLTIALYALRKAWTAPKEDEL